MFSLLDGSSVFIVVVACVSHPQNNQLTEDPTTVFKVFALLHDVIPSTRGVDALKKDQAAILVKCFQLLSLLASVGSAVQQMVRSNVFFYILIGFRTGGEVKIWGPPHY